MPYIKKEVRKDILPLLKPILNRDLKIGEVNYIITKLLISYTDHKGLNYENLNAVEGVLQCAAKEFYRRVTARYETSKMKDPENGDVYY